MHGRQHTGVSIYEARTETGEKDERSGRGDARATTRATRRRRRRQQRETPDDGRRENRRKREDRTRERRRKQQDREGRRFAEDEDAAERGTPTRERPRSFASLTHHLRVPKLVSSTIRRWSLSLSLLRAKQTSLLLAFLLALPLPTSQAFPHHPPTVQPFLDRKSVV